jgi:integrase/recombinase XerD
MLTAQVEHYLTFRRTLGFRLDRTAHRLHAFVQFAAATGDTHVRASTAAAWAAEAPSPAARHVRLQEIRRLARFLHAEDPAHEIPPTTLFPAPKRRRLPYIYAPEELRALVAAAGRLRTTYPLRRQVYATLLGLLAATGLRVSEALDLRLGDVLPDGILHIRRTKFGKSRLIPLHPTVVAALRRYLALRGRQAVPDDHVFLSAGGRRIASSTIHDTFYRVLRLAEIARDQHPRPRIHDLRHTVATRALQQCATRREAVARHFVALATYLGHADIADTYWYLEATPELLADMAAAAEALVAKEEA